MRIRKKIHWLDDAGPNRIKMEVVAEQPQGISLLNQQTFVAALEEVTMLSPETVSMTERVRL